MTRMLAAHLFRAAVAAFALSLSFTAWADYPDHAIRILVPFPAGGASDVMARAIAQPLSQALGQPVVIENKPGADGVIAGETVANSPADGYTLLMGAGTGMTYAPLARLQPPYDPVNGFTPIGLVCDAAFFLYVHDGVPARSVNELIALAHARPGALNHGSGTAFATLASLQFARKADIQMVNVPYKGEAPMFQDLMAGRIQFAIASGGGLGFAKDGRVRVLATTLPRRSTLVPEAPTLGEAGVGRVDVVPWLGLFGPPRMAPDTVERIARALRTVLDRPDVREQSERLAFQIRPSSPQELKAFVKDQLETWHQAMDAAGIKPQ
ncbi:MAG TPA: tripartite tricarboxylate transporter substrate binding protein [Ramlibacter sp.]|uniref:Bug family tripartite tricarboxylate transporter substrate binding protein n=1 Tax=Ramlibacter sp. TaxID=1917967 RepID=UPI002C4E7C47|nr:tripartite tricarboxylate transporter substrate binding protein [Ramlibacter sp.]HVZ44939.1 tripartite tricarboxylate transporter substrate binding protein [Ramlibacter sp.]